MSKKLKMGGYNFQDLEKDNQDLVSMLDIERELDMRERPQKKKKKINFDKLFPAPKHNENMGMGNLYEGKPFEGLL